MNIIVSLRNKRERKKEQERGKERRQDTKQPTNLFFISSTRLSMHIRKKQRHKPLNAKD